MTPFTDFQPGAELGCSTCVFVTTDSIQLECVIALELASFGETLTANSCPRSMQEQAA